MTEPWCNERVRALWAGIPAARRAGLPCLGRPLPARAAVTKALPMRRPAPRFGLTLASVQVQGDTPPVARPLR